MFGMWQQQLLFRHNSCNFKYLCFSFYSGLLFIYVIFLNITEYQGFLKNIYIGLSLNSHYVSWSLPLQLLKCDVDAWSVYIYFQLHIFCFKLYAKYNYKYKAKYNNRYILCMHVCGKMVHFAWQIEMVFSPFFCQCFSCNLDYLNSLVYCFSSFYIPNMFFFFFFFLGVLSL